MKRVCLASLALLCVMVTGCVEGEVTHTVNPDGSAKVRLEVVTVKPFDPVGPPQGKKQDDGTIEDLLRSSVRAFLESPGVVAWKDVSAEFLPNGKLKFAGTAYVRRLQDFQPEGIPLVATNYVAERGGDGSFKLLLNKDKDMDNSVAAPQRKQKTPDEIKKMTDAELDKYMLLELVEFQSRKPLLVAMLSGAKLKSTYVLPGNPTAVAGFDQDGRRVSVMVEGDKVLAAIEKLLAQDRAAWRGIYRRTTDSDVWKTLLIDKGFGNGSATVAKPGEAQFDFLKEVREARDAYPALRKKFGFGDDLQLPTGDNPPLPPKP